MGYPEVTRSTDNVRNEENCRNTGEAFMIIQVLQLF